MECRSWKIRGLQAVNPSFPPAASVLNYNILSMIISDLATEILTLPIIAYYDNFGFTMPSCVCELSLNTSISVCDTIGFEMGKGESRQGTRITSLGLQCRFPNPTNHMSLTISLPGDQAKNWSHITNSMIKDGSVAHSQVGGLVGKLDFAQTYVFKKFARCEIQTLYSKLSPNRYHPKLNTEISNSLKWWSKMIRLIQSMTVFRENEGTCVIIYRRLLRT